MFYRAFGLTIQTDVKLPLPAAADDHTADVLIEEGIRSIDTPGAWIQCGATAWAKPRLLRLEIPGQATLHIEAGSLVRYQIHKASSDGGFMSPPVFTTAIGALLQQRGIALLHAAAVRNADDTLLLAGSAGSGKSTLAAALTLQGFSHLSDDLAAVNDLGQIIPSELPCALWQNATKSLGIPKDELIPLRPPIQKYWWNPRVITVQPTRPNRVFILSRTHTPSPQVTPIVGNERIIALYENVPRRRILHAFASPANTFRAVTSIAAASHFQRLALPIQTNSVRNALDLLLQSS
ncbi:MAG: hypothetical protein OMOMHJEC_00872 [Xanthomonadales bacterium]|nr:hypothetical protein [Xanthomonadales bacterium]